MPKQKNHNNRRSEMAPKTKTPKRFKEFIQCSNRIADACAVKDGMHFIPKALITRIFQSSFHPITISSYKEGEGLTKKEHAVYKAFIYHGLQRFQIPLSKNGPTISLYDYLTVGWAYQYVLAQHVKNNGENANKIAHLFRLLISSDNALENKMSHIYTALQVVSTFLARINSIYFVIHFNPQFGMVPYPHIRFNLKVQRIDAQKNNYCHNSQRRPIYRVGASDICGKFSWAKMTASKFNIDHIAPDYEMSVYVQYHTLKRLKERLDCITLPTLQKAIYDNIMRPEILYRKNNQYLISYYLKSHRVGYLVCCIYRKMVVIKTFLLLTQSNTPERKKLQQKLHVEKYDLNYFQLNKLSHFIASDIPQDESLFQTFKECDCDGLFKMKRTETLNKTEDLHHVELLKAHIKQFEEAHLDDVSLKNRDKNDVGTERMISSESKRMPRKYQEKVMNE